MIRRMEAADLDAAAEIWLASNLDAHDFIPAEYWRGNFQAVKAQLPEAEVYVCEEDGRLSGSSGLEGEYIAGLFVAKPDRSRGVGSSCWTRPRRRTTTWSCACTRRTGLRSSSITVRASRSARRTWTGAPARMST